MTNKKNTNLTSKIEDTVTTEDSEFTTTRRERPARRKTYERIASSDIPQEIVDHFAKDDYDVKLVRWAIKGNPDYRYLNRREQEGYEFVQTSEVPESYLRTMRLRDTHTIKGLITNGDDLCLMKIDKDLRRSRKDYFGKLAKDQLDSVDINVLEKKGLRNLGSKSKVIMREPQFRD